MARRHRIAPIAPFPPDINRELFGAWFSGFFDGEGCFWLATGPTKNCGVAIRIGLRSDDLPVLELIRSYFGCGSIRVCTDVSTARPGNKQKAILQITGVSNLANVIIPHFERHPLRSKKARDFPIWKEAVLLLSKVAARKQTSISHGPGKLWGLPKWTREERRQLDALISALKAQRKFQAAIATLPPRKPPAPDLFG